MESAFRISQLTKLILQCVYRLELRTMFVYSIFLYTSRWEKGGEVFDLAYLANLLRVMVTQLFSWTTRVIGYGTILQSLFVGNLTLNILYHTSCAGLSSEVCTV